MDISYINKIIFASFVYNGINDLNFSCPAVSYNNKVTVWSSINIGILWKSKPIVAW